MTPTYAAWGRRGLVLCAAILVIGFAMQGAPAGGAAIEAGMAPLATHVPAAVSSGLAPRVAVLASEQHLKLALNLPVPHQAELDEFLRELYDPQSSAYHRYLSVAEYTARFGPTQADYDAVVSWAKANGFAVTNTVPNRRLVDVDGSVAVVNHAFHLTMTLYQHPTEGRRFYAPDREPTPDLAVRLLQVTGLDNYRLPHTHLKKGSAAAISNAVAHVTGSGPSGEYLPSDMRAAYYGSGSLTGAGQSIGIFSFDGYKSADVTLYKTSTGMTFSTPINNVLVNGYSGVCDAGDGSGTSTCDDGEQVLDIVNAIGMAPGITQIIFYEGSSATDILNRMVSDNTAKVLSCSWGGGDFSDTADDPIYQEMAAQGQTYANATGDSGAYNSSTWDPPSADPNILEVGGTDLTTAGAGGVWSGETGWLDSGGGYIAAAGESTPSYQKLAGVITSTNKGSTTYRNDPDVAAEANFDNPTVSNGSFETGYGGTSFATPRWAGFIALMNQQSVANGHGTVGFVNSALYTLGVGGGGDYHDITSGNNKPSAGSGAGFNATTGYDLVTGWGSPNGPTLINAVAGGSTVTSDFTLSAAPSSLSVAQASKGTSTISVAAVGGFSGSVALKASGLPTGVTAAFSPATATTSSTLTLTASSTATVGSATVTITGTSGSLTHTVTISLTVTASSAANFSLAAAPATLSIAQGASGSDTLTVTPTGGFTGSVSLAASGLPTGVTAAFTPASTTTTSVLKLTASSSATTGTSTVTITGTSGSLSHSTTLSLTVTAAGGGTATELLVNTGFETGTATPWKLTAGVLCSAATCSGESPHTGTYFAYLDGYGTTHTDTAAQSVLITAGKTTATLSYYLHIDTAETTTTTAYDTLKVQVLNSGGTVLATLATYSNLNKVTGYVVHTANLAAYIGQTVTVKFTGTEDESLQTSFVLDDITLTVQ